MKSREDYLIAVAELYRRPLSTVAVDMFLGATADLTDREFLHGIGQCCKTCKFMPTPSEVIDAAQPLVAKRKSQQQIQRQLQIRQEANAERQRNLHGAT